MSELGTKIVNGEYPPIDDSYSKGLAALIDSMLQNEPRGRPHIQAILATPYMQAAMARLMSEPAVSSS